MNKWLLAPLAVSVSALQAWDSNALDAEGGIQLVIAVGVLVPAAAILLSPSFTARLVAAGVSVAILATARLLSDVHMPELMLAGGFAGILILASMLRPEAAPGSAQDAQFPLSSDPQ